MTTPSDATAGTASATTAAVSDASATGAVGTDAAGTAAAAAAATAAAAAATGTVSDERYGTPTAGYADYKDAQFQDSLKAGLHQLGKDLNLSDKGMAAVYKTAAAHAASTEKVFADAHAENLADWQAKAAADTEYGGEKFAENRAIAAKGLDMFGTPALREILKESGLENHPEFFRVFFRVGKAVSEDKFVRGGTTAPVSAGGLFSYDKSQHNAS